MRIEDMTPEQWEEAFVGQTRYLGDQLDAMHRTGTWAKYRLLQVRCGHCGDIIAEVMDTDLYRVVRAWGARETKGEVTPPPRDPKEVRAWLASRTRLTRRGKPTFFPIPNNWPPEAGARFDTACRCRGWTLSGALLADALAAGRKKIVLRRRAVLRCAASA